MAHLNKCVGITDGEPQFEHPLSLTLAELVPGGALKVLSPAEHISARQRGWYRGPCLKGLSGWNGETPEEWDYRLKGECGDTLPTEPVFLGYMSDGKPVVANRRTIRGAGKQAMTAFIENILSKAIENEWPVTPPDPELRSKQHE